MQNHRRSRFKSRLLILFILFLILSVELFVSPSSADDRNFGQTTGNTTAAAIEGVVRGSNFTYSLDQGRPNYIMVYLDKSNAAGQTWYAKCSIYYASNNTYFGTTENRSIRPGSASFRWFRFNITTGSRKTLTTGVTYRLYVWGNNSKTGTLNVGTTSGGTNYQRISKTLAFTNNWPSTLSGLTYASGSASIYCVSTLYVDTQVITPQNASTNLNKQPTCRIWANQSVPNTGLQLTVNFYENSTGSWVRRQTNASVAVNQTVQWNYSQATVLGAGQRYWWKTTVAGGSWNISRVYYFNLKPQQLTTYPTFPKNGTTDVCALPTARVWANNSEGGSTTVNFYVFEKGTWARKQTNVSVPANSMVTWNISQASINGGQVDWRATIFDGTMNNSYIYSFTVKNTVNSPPTVAVIFPKNSSTDINLQPACRIWANDTNGGTVTVNFYENSSGGGWVHRQKNSSVAANSTVQWNYSQATVLNTIYWWKVTVDDLSTGPSTNLTRVYKFTTKSPGGPPTITINFAGNPNDHGGPYYQPPGESTQLTGAFAEGYYTNDSMQVEDWIFINISIASDSTVDFVWLNWIEGGDFNNWTFAFQKAGDSGNWIINKTVTEPVEYSFDVVANNSDGSTIAQWNKTKLGGGYARRTVHLASTPSTISYTDGPYYLWQTNFSAGDQTKYDRLQRDQSADGGPIDTGYLKTNGPQKFMMNRSCSQFVAYWFNEDKCVPDFTITNIYFHTWVSAVDGRKDSFNQIGWQHTRATPATTLRDSFSFNADDARSTIFYHEGLIGGTERDHNYSLMTHLLNTNTVSFTENNITELFISIGNSTSASPLILCNRSVESFILFNVPSNVTLNSTNSDSDTLNDWMELFVTYTNPFVDDTDNDGYSDNSEYVGGSDPNNRTSIPSAAPHSPVLTLATCQPGTGVASYTIFKFNVTWADSNGDDPADGYLKVNISRTGWYLNVSMNWVSGSNTTGASYTYSMELTAGSYTYVFIAFDGVYYSNTGLVEKPTVSAQSYSIGVTQSDSVLWFNMSSWGTYGTQLNCNASGQTPAVPALAILNQGNVPINLTIKINVSVDAGLSLKWDDDNAPGGATVITTSENTIHVNLAVGQTKSIWLWMDFTNAGPGSGIRTITITSSQGG
jgi:hypothetical protein